jgi:hypothetical protein
MHKKSKTMGAKCANCVAEVNKSSKVAKNVLVARRRKVGTAVCGIRMYALRSSGRVELTLN